MHTIPFEFVGNKPLVEARVNGAGPFSFLVDNGSSFDVVDTRVAAAGGVPVTGSDALHGAGESALESAFGSARLAIGELDLGERDIVVMPIDAAIAHASGHRVDGLFGYPLFEHFAVELCYVGRHLVLHEPLAQGFEGTRIPLEVVREHAMVDATILLADGTRANGTFMVDTASRSPLLLTRPFAEQAGVAATASRSIVTTTGWGIGGPTRDIVARVSALELGPLRFENVFVNCSTARSGVLSESSFAGIIGGEVLRRCHVVIDYAAQRLILEPNAAFEEPFEFDQSGILVSAEREDLRRFRVADVTPDSPASETDIRAGDFIETVDGRDASDLTLDELKRLFRAGPGTTYRLGLLRDGAPLVRTLELRRLV